MALALYLDDCADSIRLRDALVALGHRAVRPSEAGVLGAADPVHFTHAIAAGLILITMNPRDFEALHLDRLEDERSDAHGTEVALAPADAALRS